MLTIKIYCWLFLGVSAAALVVWRGLRSPSETAGDKRKEIRRIEVEYGFPERDPNRRSD